MIKEVSKIVDNKFVITAKVPKGIKVYSIGEDSFVTRLNNEEEWDLYHMHRDDFRCDGQLVYGLVSELEELENTYIVTSIVQKYVNGASVEWLREEILSKLEKQTL